MRWINHYDRNMQGAPSSNFGGATARKCQMMPRYEPPGPRLTMSLGASLLAPALTRPSPPHVPLLPAHVRRVSGVVDPRRVLNRVVQGLPELAVALGDERDASGRGRSARLVRGPGRARAVQGYPPRLRWGATGSWAPAPHRSSGTA